MVPDSLHDEHESRQRHEHEADPAVEAPRLGVRPGVERARYLPSLVGVGAQLLARAGVADVGTCAVTDQASCVVGLVPAEVLSFRALPGVKVGVVGEARRAVPLGAQVRMTGEPLQAECCGQQEERVSHRHQRLWMDAVHRSTAGSSPAAP